MVLDTHTWYWFVTGSNQLSEKTASKIEKEISNVKISSISLWEFLILLERKKLKIRGTGEGFIEEVEKTFPFSIEPVTKQIAILSRNLIFQHEDPADRFIAATAHSLGEPLLTRDENLLSLLWLRSVKV